MLYYMAGESTWCGRKDIKLEIVNLSSTVKCVDGAYNKLKHCEVREKCLPVGMRSYIYNKKEKVRK